MRPPAESAMLPSMAESRLTPDQEHGDDGRPSRWSTLVRILVAVVLFMTTLSVRRLAQGVEAGNEETMIRGMISTSVFGSAFAVAFTAYWFRLRKH